MLRPFTLAPVKKGGGWEGGRGGGEGGRGRGGVCGAV